MAVDTLKNTDTLDIEDLIIKIEKSFGIEFAENELSQRTFGELCDYIINKIELKNIDSCTSQQAFYKLREAVSSTLFFEKEKIKPSLKLNEIFPKSNRTVNVEKVENYLNFKLNVLEIPNWIIGIQTSIIIGSIILLFLDWKISFFGISISILFFLISKKTEKDLNVKTVGDLVYKMTKENYLKSRRNQETYNKKEIENLLIDWFSKELYLEKNQLTREAEFI
jgi:acyl carrier protein